MVTCLNKVANIINLIQIILFFSIRPNTPFHNFRVNIYVIIKYNFEHPQIKMLLNIQHFLHYPFKQKIDSCFLLNVRTFYILYTTYPLERGCNILPYLGFFLRICCKKTRLRVARKHGYFDFFTI